MSLLYIIGSEVATTAGFAAIKYVYSKCKGTKKTKRTPMASDMHPRNINTKIEREHSKKFLMAREKLDPESPYYIAPEYKAPQPRKRYRSTELELGERVRVTRGSIDRDDILGSLPKSLVEKLSTEFGSLPSSWESYRNVMNQTFIISCKTTGKSISLCDSLDFDPDVFGNNNIPDVALEDLRQSPTLKQKINERN